MSTFVDGIGCSANIDTSGEMIDIAGMDISSLATQGVFNYEHKSDLPAQVVGKILKAHKIFSEKDCEDDRQLFFWNKCQVPYIYVMGELFDDYNESAREVAGMFKYDADRQNKNQGDVVGFSIEGAYLQRDGSLVKRSIARKCTITTSNCNKMAIAKLIPSNKQSDSIDELFKTELNTEVSILKNESIAGGASSALEGGGGAMIPSDMALSEEKHLGTHMGDVGKFKIMSHARPEHYPFATHKEVKGIIDAHHKAHTEAKDPKTKEHHLNQTKRFMQVASRMRPKSNVVQKSMTAGSMNVAPSQLTGGAALYGQSKPVKANVSRPDKGFGAIIHKPGTAPKTGRVIVKSDILKRAEQDYEKWPMRKDFEEFLSKRMPHLTKTEIKVIGQTLALQNSHKLEKSLANMVGYNLPTLVKAGGKDSIYTLILFEGCELHDILHCSHFATDAIDKDTFNKIVDVCDKYFSKKPESEELEFKEIGVLGKKDQRVLFLTKGNPYKDLFDKLDEIAPYKYPKFRPHISVTSNVDEFVGKPSSLVISLNGEIKKQYNFKHIDKIPGGLADKKKPEDFDPEQLAEGIKVEMEHTSDPKIALEIAMDHLQESASYYKKLKTIEKK